MYEKIKCPTCGTEFVKMSNAQRFCSAKCREVASPRPTKRLRKCSICGKEIISKHKSYYCSDECRKIGQKRWKEAHKAMADRQAGKTTKANKKNIAEIAEINEKARKEGLTYGQYVAKYGYK